MLAGFVGTEVRVPGSWYVDSWSCDFSFPAISLGLRGATAKVFGGLTDVPNRAQVRTAHTPVIVLRAWHWAIRLRGPQVKPLRLVYVSSVCTHPRI